MGPIHLFTVWPCVQYIHLFFSLINFNTEYSMATASQSPLPPPLRFDIGQRVECYIDEGWQEGFVVGLYYREFEWPQNLVVPYQVLLRDHDRLIYAPIDEDHTIRIFQPQHGSSCACCNGKVHQNEVSMIWRKKNGVDIFTGIVQVMEEGGTKTCWSLLSLPNFYKLDNPKDVNGSKQLLSFAAFKAEMAVYDR